MLSLPLAEASAKVRNGPPLDGEEDYELKVSADVIPLRLIADVPINDPRLNHEIELPRYVSDYSRLDPQK